MGEGSVPGPPAHSGPYILTPLLGLDVARSPSQPNLSLLGMPREEESPGADTKGRHTNSSGSKSRILAFVTDAAGRGQSLHCVATIHCTVLYFTVLYCIV